jgi:hypothetical protein
VLTSGAAASSPELVRETRLKVSLSEACKNESLLAGYYSWEDNMYFQSIFTLMQARQLRNQLDVLGHPMDEDEKTESLGKSDAVEASE